MLPPPPPHTHLHQADRLVVCVVGDVGGAVEEVADPMPAVRLDHLEPGGGGGGGGGGG